MPRESLSAELELTNIISALIIFCMITLSKTHQTTTAKPAEIFSLWADINHWSEYDEGIEWAKLTDTFAEGSHYTIKPKGGPVVKATILTVETNRCFIDVSHLFGANLTFDHRLAEQNGHTTVSITMTLRGPLAWLWVKVLGKNQQADLEKSTANLIKKAEQRS